MNKKNPCNRKNFEMACQMLHFINPELTFVVNETYLDFGAGMQWETIICTNGTSDVLGTYQMLSPRDWEKLNACTGLQDITTWVLAINDDQQKTFDHMKPKAAAPVVTVEAPDSNKLELTYVGNDSWDRPVYLNHKYNAYYVDVNPRKGRAPQICTKYNNLFDGEPDCPISVAIEVVFTPERITW